MDKALLKQLDQAGIAVCVAVTLGILVLWWVVHGGPRGDLVNVEHVGPLSYEFLVDLNNAEWPELAQLPDVGEVLARRIVASRAADGPFATSEDLLRVEGIGPRRLEKVRGYLLPLPGEAVVANDP